MIKKRYRYRSEWADLLPYIVLPGVVLPGMFIYPIGRYAASDLECVILVVLCIVSSIAGLALFILCLNTKAGYSADDTSVTFSYPFKKICISYRTIKSISLERKFRKPKVRGDVPAYFEEMKIICVDEKEYLFTADIPINEEMIAADLENLKKQFEKGALYCLEKHIKGSGYGRR